MNSPIDRKAVAYVLERDIDLILVEELEVSEEFRIWLASRVFEGPIYKSRCGAYHSESNDTGETDVLFVFDSKEGGRTAILIENKIDALAQPDQGKRYRERGDQGKNAKQWDDYRTCLIAPRRYLGSPKQTESYDTTITYEELMSYFLARSALKVQGNERFGYRAAVIQAGIERRPSSYQPETNTLMTDFVRSYCEHARRSVPELGVEEAKPRPAGSTWIIFTPKGLPANAQVAHQLTNGYVKVFFYGAQLTLEMLQARYADAPIDGLELQKHGKSVAIALRVQKVNPLKQLFETAVLAMDDAMAKVGVLVRLAQERGPP